MTELGVRATFITNSESSFCYQWISNNSKEFLHSLEAKPGVKMRNTFTYTRLHLKQYALSVVEIKTTHIGIEAIYSEFAM